MANGEDRQPDSCCDAEAVVSENGSEMLDEDSADDVTNADTETEVDAVDDALDGAKRGRRNGKSCVLRQRDPNERKCHPFDTNEKDHTEPVFIMLTHLPSCVLHSVGKHNVMEGSESENIFKNTQASVSGS